jgi:hypothetical protein
MRESAVRDLLVRANADWSLVEKMLAEGKLKAVEYLGKRYFVRCFTPQWDD